MNTKFNDLVLNSPKSGWIKKAKRRQCGFIFYYIKHRIQIKYYILKRNLNG